MLNLLTRSKKPSVGPLSKEDQNLLADARLWSKRNKPANALHYLAENGHARLLRLEATHGDPRLDEKNVLGFSPLHIAVLNGHFETFMHLLKLGADPNTRSHSGNSVLATAVTKWLVETDSDDGKKFCWKLLEEGAQTDSLDQDGNTIVHLAVTTPSSEERRKSVLRVIFAFGGKLNAKSKAGVSGVAQAIYSYVDVDETVRNSESRIGEKTIRWLLDRPFDLTAENNQGGDLVAELLNAKAWSLAHCLLDIGAQGDGSTRDGVSGLKIAASQGQCQLMQRLLSASSQAGKLRNGNIVIGVAAGAINAGTVDAKAILDIILPGFDINSLLGAGKGTLLWDTAASYLQDPEQTPRKCALIRLLITKYNADPRIAGPSQTVLEAFLMSLAQNRTTFDGLSDHAKQDAVDLVELFFEKGVTFRQQHSAGHFVLFDAVRTGHIPLIELLRNYDAPDVWTGKDLRQWSLLHLSATLFEHELLKYLLNRNEKILKLDFGTPLNDAAAVGNLRGAEMLVECGADLEARAFDGQTALHRAAAGGFDIVLQLLIRCGANVKALTNARVTPLHLYLGQTRRDVRIVRMLVERGALVNALTEDYRSPLDYWMDTSTPGEASAASDWAITSYLRGVGAHPMKFMFPSTTPRSSRRPKSVRDTPMMDDGEEFLVIEKGVRKVLSVAVMRRVTP